MDAATNRNLPSAAANPYAQRLSQSDLLRGPVAEAVARQQALGLLGILSGDEALAAAGGQVLRQQAAEQARQDQQAARAQDRADAWNAQQAAYAQRREDQVADLKSRQDFEERMARQRAADNLQWRRESRENRQEPLMIVVGANGQPQYVPRSQAVGQQPGSVSAGNASEDERKAAGWVSQAGTALGTMKDIAARNPGAMKPSAQELMLNRVSPDAAYAAMTPDRQAFTTAASSLGEAVLRAATGAGMNEYEARQKVNELTPRWGEDPSVTAKKMHSADVYLQSLQTRAGRALPSGQGAAAPAPAGPRVFTKTLGGGAGAGDLSAAEQAELAQLRQRFGK